MTVFVSVLITSSLKFRSMLNSKFCEGSPPVLQINDIRYEIFDTVTGGPVNLAGDLTNDLQYFR